jgi:PTH1 family peptidyl-tRNA hydrolase
VAPRRQRRRRRARELSGSAPDRLVVGLGNPGARYAATRHNVGFRVVERLAARHGAVFEASEALSGRVARRVVGGLDCALLEPTTFMNRSGDSVAAALACWPGLVPERDLLVVYDDLDLPLGRLRLRPGGSAGGHRGIADIARALATNAIPRLRFGIGHPGSAAAVVDWVLEPFSAEEETERLPAAIDRAADAVVCVLADGLATAMDRFNAAA